MAFINIDTLLIECITHALASLIYLNALGETINSYSFEGYYSRKWNSSISLPYGKKWRVGNIMGCVINFPKNYIEYFQ